MDASQGAFGAASPATPPVAGVGAAPNRREGGALRPGIMGESRSPFSWTDRRSQKYQLRWLSLCLRKEGGQTGPQYDVV
jgi:hypothetical protein